MDETRKEICKREYASGKTLSEVGKIVGCTGVTVAKVLRDAGIPRRSCGRARYEENTLLKMFASSTIEMKREPNICEFSKILGIAPITLMRYRRLYPSVASLPYGTYRKPRRKRCELKIPAINEEVKEGNRKEEVVVVTENHGSSEAEAEITKVEAEVNTTSQVPVENKSG